MVDVHLMDNLKLKTHKFFLSHNCQMNASFFYFYVDKDIEKMMFTNWTQIVLQS